jgi:O-antigen biosynthesis protein WbqP
MLRTLDIVFSSMALLLALPVLIVFIPVLLTQGKNFFFVQTRVGSSQKEFRMIKIRSLPPGTPEVATHLLNAEDISPFYAWLRKTKLDELPQIWNVLVGDMSLVGPRPCLPTQKTLIAARLKRGIFAVRPGITGLAQIQGIDMSNEEKLVCLDEKLLKDISVKTYFRCIFKTVF